MPRFVELTARDGRRLLFNPENVANFGAPEPTSALAAGSGTTILMTSSAHPAYVREAPDEVLRRFCPEEREGHPLDGNPGRAAVAEVLHNIAAFRRLTEEEEKTDTGAAWELLDDIEDTLKGLG